MIEILHLSDTHVHSKSTNEPLIEKLSYIRSHYPEYLKLISGDVTDDGHEEQYARAQEIIVRSFVVPGNHDYGPIGSIYYKDSAKQFDSFAQIYGQEPFYNKTPHVTLIENVAIIGLNSCKKTGSPLDFARGRIGWWQRWQLGRLLDRHRDRVRIVMLHHHPFIHGDPTMELEDGKDFIRTIYGKVDILLFGHKHLQAQWYDKAGCKVVLAAGAAFREETAKAIVVDEKTITVDEVKII
jgi:3',5'-cyclic AMP phosphodiesterase CpdA